MGGEEPAGWSLVATPLDSYRMGSPSQYAYGSGTWSIILSTTLTRAIWLPDHTSTFRVSTTSKLTVVRGHVFFWAS